MKKVDSNKIAWALLAEDHYKIFKKELSENSKKLNPDILNELGNIKGKSILHLQCNTGSDSIMLSKMGAIVTGVDFVPENIYYARKLAQDFGIDNIRFIESDIMKLMDIHHEKYDIVFTSEGVLLWLPDKKIWAKTIRHCLKDDGYFYLYDSHPFYLIFDEDEFPKGNLIPKYPYFNKEVEIEDSIGGYASEVKKTTCYSWMFTIGDIVNSLSQAGLYIEYIHEFDKCSHGMASLNSTDEQGLGYVKELLGKIPLTMSIKAVVR